MSVRHFKMFTQRVTLEPLQTLDKKKTKRQKDKKTKRQKDKKTKRQKDKKTKKTKRHLDEIRNNAGVSPN